MRSLAGLAVVLAGVVLASSCAAGTANDDECSVGGEGCPCTEGGACDPGLSCLSNLCVNPVPTGSGGATSQSTTGSNSPASTGNFMSGSTGSGCMQTGCKKIDVLFALDGSGSMTEEINSLAASQSFTQTIQALAALNCGDIHYRIGVTNDNDGGFIVPNGWAGPKPWFDSETMAASEIAAAFGGSCSKINGGSGVGTGCEHVLSSSAQLVATDSTGFIRPDALLVLVLVTDVDDYGAYDHQGFCSLFPSEGCPTTGAPVAQIYGNLVAKKGGDPKSVAAIVVAGDPNVNAGKNFCDQPGSCGCVDMGGGFVDCSVFHADRLWEFANAQAGMNGYKGDLCAGPQSVPDAVKAALTSSIDLACQNYVPPS